MRVLFNTIPCASHIDPLVPLAHVLQSAGHEVRVSTGVHGQIVGRSDVEATITAAGLTAVPLGAREPEPTGDSAQPFSASSLRVPGALVQPIGEESWRVVRDELIALFSWHVCPDSTAQGRFPVLEDLVAFARAWQPDLLLWDFLGPAASIAAEAIGIPHVRMVFAEDKMALVDEWQPADDDRFGQWMRPLLQRYGLTYSKQMLLGQCSIDANSIRTGQARSVRYLPMRRIPYNGAESLPAWLHQPPKLPRVCLTLGWSIMRNLDHFDLSAAELSKVASALGVEMVVTLAPDQLTDDGALPDNIRAAGYVPLNVLLPTCSAIVHHGGTGTLAAAIAHRTPQLIIPVANWNEAADARHIQDHGAGLILDSRNFSTERLHDHLQRILNEPTFQTGANDLHTQSLSTPSPIEMASILERLAARPRSATPKG